MLVPAGNSAESYILNLLEDLGACYWEAGLDDLRVLTLVSRSETVLGFPRNEWLNSPDFLRHHLKPEAVEQFLNVGRTGVPATVDFSLRNPAGDLFRARTKAHLSPEKRICGLLLDVTAEKQAEEAQVNSGKRTRYLLEHARDLVIRADSNGKITFVNPAATRILMCEPERLTGRYFLDLVRPDYRRIVRRFYLRQLREGRNTTYFEIPVIAGDGTYLWIGQNVQLLTSSYGSPEFHVVGRNLTEIKQAEENVREREERYRIVAETATDAIATFDSNGEILFVNHSAGKIFGYATDEVIGHNLAMLLPTFPRRFQQSFAWVDLNAGQSYLGTETITLAGRHRNGSELLLEATLGEFTESDKHLFTAVIRDVTERHRVEDAIRRSDQRFRSLIENASDVICILDNGGIVLYASPSVYRILGYHSDDLMGVMSTDLVHPEDREALSNAFYLRLDRDGIGTSDPVEFRIRHHDGSWRVVEAVGRNLLKDVAVRGYVVNLRDVTDRKHAEEQLRAASETLQTLFQTSPLATIAMDADGRILKWNSAAERMFGWREVEILGGTMPMVPPSKADEALELFGILRRGQSLTVDTVRQTKSGKQLNVIISAAPMRGADGSFSGAVAVINDVTERKRLEDQLRQAQKMEAVGQLAGGIAHDFNNLLTVITGYNQLLINTLDESSRAAIYAREIMQASERAASLTRQLLAFSRRQIAQPRLLDLNNLIDNMRRMLERLVGESVDVVIALCHEQAQINADSVQVEQIILNLAVNARDAMPDGGKLTIETTIVELDQEYSRTHVNAKSGPHVMLAVTDTGHGMDEETRLRVFEPFFTTKDTGKGTGLGLSTVYGIVQQNSASIWVYSEEGLGSTFKVYFPLAVSLKPFSAVEETTPDLRGSETVLLVEHEPGLRSLIQELLVTLGYTVLTAADREEAEQVCRNSAEPIHLMLSDVVMPDTTGRELAHELLALRPNMRVLYMSGYPGEAILQNGLITPASPFLQKPFSQEALALKIRQVLEG